MQTHIGEPSRVAGDRSLLAAKAYYFAYYAGMAALVPFLVLYYRHLGLTGSVIGVLAGIPPFVTWIAAPLWGALADATQRHKLLMVIANTGAIVVVLALSLAENLWWLLPLVIGYALFSAPLMPLVDNAVMALLGDRSGEYGKQRLWGAIGWGAAGAVAGWTVERYGLTVSFYTFGAWMALGLVAALRLPIGRAPIGQPFWVGLRGLLGDRRLLVFLLTAFLAGVAMSSVNSFYFLYLQDLGASATLMGLSLALATLSELPVFFFSGLLIHRFGARGLLVIALFLFVLRLTIYAVFPVAGIALAANLLHGLTFSAAWVAGVTYANQIAPSGMGATAQGLFSGVMMGLGAALGALVGGMVYEAFGPQAMYAIMAAIVAVGIVFFWLAGGGREGGVGNRE